MADGSSTLLDSLEHIAVAQFELWQQVIHSNRSSSCLQFSLHTYAGQKTIHTLLVASNIGLVTLNLTATTAAALGTPLRLGSLACRRRRCRRRCPNHPHPLLPAPPAPPGSQTICQSLIHCTVAVNHRAQCQHAPCSLLLLDLRDMPSASQFYMVCDLPMHSSGSCCIITISTGVWTAVLCCLPPLPATTLRCMFNDIHVTPTEEAYHASPLISSSQSPMMDIQRQACSFRTAAHLGAHGKQLFHRLGKLFLDQVLRQLLQSGKRPGGWAVTCQSVVQQRFSTTYMCSLVRAWLRCGKSLRILLFCMHA